MDEICRELADMIFKAGGGGYAVLYEDELLEAIPDGERNRDLLEAALKKLRSGGYIDVRYARGNAFCMAGLKPYELPAEDKSPAVIRTKRREFASAVYFLSAFVGAALGGALCFLIAVLLKPYA